MLVLVTLLLLLLLPPLLLLLLLMLLPPLVRKNPVHRAPTESNCLPTRPTLLQLNVPTVCKVWKGWWCLYRWVAWWCDPSASCVCRNRLVIDVLVMCLPVRVPESLTPARKDAGSMLLLVIVMYCAWSLYFN